MMKKTSKLMLRKATVRVLSGKALTHVIGGQETDAADARSQSGDKQCGSGLIAALDGVSRNRG
jgi:hypothetical protein